MDVKKIIKAIKLEAAELGFTVQHADDNLQPLAQVYSDIGEHLIETAVNEAISVLQIFNRNSFEKLIGEMDLRRVLTQYLNYIPDR